MRVSEILRHKGADVIVIAPSATVAELIALLSDNNLGAVVVSDDGSAVHGIVSERDVVHSLSKGTSVLSEPVSTIMSSTVQTCSVGDSVESLMGIMTELRVRHVPVVTDSSRLCGIISIGDVVKSTITQLEFERDQLEGYVTHS
jgi:CBS domain-containing protein